MGIVDVVKQDVEVEVEVRRLLVLVVVGIVKLENVELLKEQGSLEVEVVVVKCEYSELKSKVGHADVDEVSACEVLRTCV